MSQMQVPNEAYHIERVLKGETQAYAILVEYYKDLVFTICKRITQNDEDAEECAQDTFLKAFKSLETFRQEAKFSTWLFRIAYNTAISKQRRQKHEHQSTDDRQVLNLSFDDTESGYRSLGNAQRTHYLKLAIAALSGEEANLVSLYYYNELSIAEIQEVTGIEVNNIKVKLHRARKKLQESLQRLLKDELEEIL
jgi:RNA polymerase sigma factor (sigma-70 family)